MQYDGSSQMAHPQLLMHYPAAEETKDPRKKYALFPHFERMHAKDATTYAYLTVH